MIDGNIAVIDELHRSGRYHDCKDEIYPLPTEQTLRKSLVLYGRSCGTSLGIVMAIFRLLANRFRRTPFLAVLHWLD